MNLWMFHNWLQLKLLFVPNLFVVSLILAAHPVLAVVMLGFTRTCINSFFCPSITNSFPFIIWIVFQIPPKDECVKALTKMSSCPACQGIPEIQPCRGYCINVMKGCLAFHAQLSDSWNEFIGKCVCVFSSNKKPTSSYEIIGSLGLGTFVAICFMTFDKAEPRLNGFRFCFKKAYSAC